MGFLPGKMQDIELPEQVLSAIAPLTRRKIQRLQDGMKIFSHGHLSEDRGLLGEIPYPFPRTNIHRQICDAFMIYKNIASIRPQESYHHVKDCRLACPVGPQKSYHLTGVNA